MNRSYHANLVDNALLKRKSIIKKALQESISLESFDHSPSAIAELIRDLKFVNDYITVADTILDEAKADYEAIARSLVDKLDWPGESIKIIPQGSASTQTLIRSPDNSKFDIDAVCSVDLSSIEVKSPMDFYEKIGQGLEEWKPIQQKRCWKVNINNRRYYIEFTPSTPLDNISENIDVSIDFSPSIRYREKALAVVDTPTKKWKTSNPEGFSLWVTEQSQKPLLRYIIEKTIESYSAESIEPVPNQDVDITDTLRIAIRLLKRHRDISVKRGFVDKDLKPISIIIVTLLTQCYEGLADRGDIYTHPLELFIDLVELMPYMIEKRGEEYWIANPTVEGENFAEKWNKNPNLRETFERWAVLLLDDLREIMSTTSEEKRRQLIQKVFGCSTTTPVIPNGSGLASKKPSQAHKAPPTKGLA